jgi:DNA-binding transcriptional LysR family regulator
MIVEQLEALHAVVKHGGFERASASLRLSQPAISIRIKELEKQLGIELFIRSGRRDQLTEAGRVVDECATRLMMVLREMHERVDELKGIRKGQLRCGAATTIAVHLLPGILVRFKKAFPEIDIRLQVGRTAETVRRILADELDIGVVTGTIANAANLKMFHFMTDEFVFICPPNHPLAKPRRTSLQQIAKAPLILREKGSLTRSIVEKSFTAAGLPCPCMMEIETTEGLKKAVAEGLGCSFVPRCSIQTEVKTGALAYHRIANACLTREFRVIMHKDKTLSGPIRPFLELLKVSIPSP